MRHFSLIFFSSSLLFLCVQHPKLSNVHVQHNIAFASRQSQAQSAAPEMHNSRVMKTPRPRRPARVCACGWVHRLGKPTTCPLASIVTGDAGGGSGTSVRERPAPPPAPVNSYVHRKMKPSYRWSILKTQARRRGILCDVPFEAFLALTRRPCHYCGDHTTERFRGLDRVDNDRGYTMANVVPCCPVCNYMKSKLTRGFFLEHTRRIVLHNSNSGARPRPLGAHSAAD